MIAFGDRLQLAGCDVDANEVRVAVLANLDQEAAAIARPDGSGGMLSARRTLIAADATVHVEIERGCQVARRAAWGVKDPEIRLAVRTDRAAVRGADERDALAVWRD